MPRRHANLPRTFAKWVDRDRREGQEGPAISCRRRTESPIGLRRGEPAGAILGQLGSCSWQVAERPRMAISTLGSVLRRLGLDRGCHRKCEPAVRYE